MLEYGVSSSNLVYAGSLSVKVMLIYMCVFLCRYNFFPEIQ